MKFPLLFIVVVNLECILSSELYETIFWVPQNLLFDKRFNNCTLELKVKRGSTAYFMCPNRGIILQPILNALLPGNMYENMWMVTSEADFNNCNATNAIPVFECDEPEELHFESVPFNPPSPHGGLSFSLGQKYFFFATSDGTLSNIDNRVGGRCSGKDNITMKFEVYVCSGTQDSECNNDTLGVLKCKGAPTELAPTELAPTELAPTELAPTTAWKTVASSENLLSDGKSDTRKSSCDDKSTDNEKQLMLVIGTLAGILFLVIVLFFVLLYKYMNKGKSNHCSFDLGANRISTQSSVVYDEKVMEEDNVYDNDCCIENKVLDKEDSPQETEEGKTKDNNQAGPVANGNTIANQA